MNIGDLITKSCRRYSKDVAIVFEDRTYTFREVGERVNRLANSLLNIGLKKGDRVAMLLHNCNQFIEADFAMARCGLVRVPLNIRLSASDHEYVLDNSGAKALIFGSPFSQQVMEIKNAPALKHLICVGGEDPCFISFEKLIAEGLPSEPGVSVEEDDLYGLVYTSGTTGRPKGVMLSHRNCVSLTLNLILERDVRRGDRLLHFGPLTHASGVWVLPHFCRGAANFILKEFNIELILETIQRHKITTLAMVPTIIIRLLSYPDLDRYDLSSLRTVNYGGSPMPAEKLKEAINKFGYIFSQNYGQTEAPTTITYLSKEEMRNEEKLLSAGCPYLRVDVKVVNKEGVEVKPGEIGEIIVKSDHVMKGYWKNEEATREKIVDGWLHTEDMATVDEEGFIYIVDRISDMIVSGGFNIYPREIEEVINSHPAVEEVCVIGVPSEKWGEEVKALVALKQGHSLTEDELLDFCKENLASIKKPKSVEFVDNLPKNAYGKIMKKDIREKYWAGKSRRVN